MHIDSYQFGQIVINGKKYESDVIIFSDEILDWWRKEGHEVALEDINDVLDKSPEIFLIGTGASGRVNVLQEVKDALKEKGVKLKALKTKKAVDFYNKNSDENIIAGFHLTC